MNTRRKIILACITSLKGAQKVLRTARRRAENADITWQVLFIQNDSESRRDKTLVEWQDLENDAKNMGAAVTRRHVVSETADDIRKALLQYHNATQAIEEIVVGQWRAWPWDNFNHTLLKLVRSTFPSSISIITVAVDQVFYHPNTWRHFFSAHATTFQHVLLALAAVAGATLAIELIDILIPGAIGSHNRNKPVVYLLACALIAGRVGLWPGIIAAIASFISINWLNFDGASYHPAELGDEVYILNLGLFLLSAVVIAIFVGQSRRQGDLARAQIKRLQSVLDMYQVIDAGDTAHKVAGKLQLKMQHILDLPTYIYLSDHTNAPVHQGLNEPALTPAEQQARNACWDQARATGYGTDYKNHLLWHFEPLVTATHSIGILAVDFKSANESSALQNDPDLSRMLASLAEQIAHLIEKADLQHRSIIQHNLLEKETLRSMLLSSISHDLKTPLVSMMGYLRLYKSRGATLSSSEQSELIDTALQEAERLKQFITNVLDLSKLESGGMKLKNEWHDSESLIKSVISMIQRATPHHKIKAVPPPLTPYIDIFVDQILFWQALQNIIENACHHTAQGTPIDVSWCVDNEMFQCIVRDYGAGIPEGMNEKIFDKYTRIEKQDYQRARTGLGLAISRAIITAHFGKIRASNHPDGGAVFTISLPQWRIMPQTEHAETEAAL